MKRVFTALAIVFGVNYGHCQQDPLISSYQFNQLLINPAYAGVNDVTSLDLHYRAQWGNIDGAPRTIFLSGNTSFFRNSIGAGVSLLQDKIGIVNNLNFNAALAYELDLTSQYTLSFGLQAGSNSLSYDYSELNLDDASDDDFVGVDQKLSQINFGTGFFLSSEHLYIGLSIPRIKEVTEVVNGIESQRYNRHYYVSAGFVLDQLKVIKLKSYTLVRITEGPAISYDLGASALFLDMLWGGLFTRNFHDYGITLLLRLEDGLRVGYTGELTSNALSTSSLNAHEITIGVDLKVFGTQVVKNRYY